MEEPTTPKQPQVIELTEWLALELSQILDISRAAVATNESFSHFGLDSAKAAVLLNRLGEFLGRKVPVTLPWKYPTIEALANHLCGKPTPSPREPGSNLFLSSATNQPIAVIGMACRFPGAPDPRAFWDLLRSGRSAFREVTPDRWDINDWYDPDLRKPGKTNARQAGLLDRVDEFDPGFFSISPREAVEMDPQQRLALELTWEALEDAGLQAEVLRGSRTGVFVGAVWHDYEALARKAGVEITAHSGTGQALSIVANRISYALGLQGPSIALDTACSSSLVSVHLACRSLQAGDATLAIAGGVNVIIDPETMVSLSKFGGLSPTNELRAFDAGANGFVRGEGGGFMVLKSLNRALADGDRIYAVIRGSAVNNDGASNGLTAPNPRAQEMVLSEACARAGIQPSDVHYVEAHGTGTPLGDPIEAHALGTVFGNERAADQPLLIGSVKTNIGHLEGASGIAGLMKLVLSVHHRQIPPSLNFKTPNPHIDFAISKLRVVTQLESWPEPGKPAWGGASAFGWGGTNCHVIVGNADRSTAHLLPLSAPDSGALKATAEKLLSYLTNLQSGVLDVTLQDVCATAAARCDSQPKRVALTARSVSDLGHQLEGFLLGQKRPGVAVGHTESIRPKLAFVFSPQGSQWLGMGKSLMAVEPVFQAKLAECDRALQTLAGWSLFDELLAERGASRLNRAEFVQPVLAAMQIALVELWSSWGVRPDLIAAHSLGEWAAACAAGALSLDETMRVVVESSRAQVRADAGGGMAVVELTEAAVQERIGRRSGEVFVAGWNSPTSTILSGDAAHLKNLVAAWKEEGVTCSLIDVDVAAHSPRMDLALEGLVASLQGLRPSRTAIPLASSVTGGYLGGTEMGPAHWARHVRQPVLFTQVIERLAHDGCTLFLEISPHPLLRGAIQQILGGLDTKGLALASCRRGDDERGSLLNSLGALYALGWPVNWPAVTGHAKASLSLPIFATRDEPVELTGLPVEAPLLFPVSGHTTEALRDHARSIARSLAANHDVALNDLAYTLGARRGHLEYRLALTETRREELSTALQAFADGKDIGGTATGHVRSSTRARIAFVCSGQGSQWWGMGRELLASMPIFRREIARCADEMKRHATWDLLEELTRDAAASRLGETEIAQPALFALQVALATVWRSWGFQPDAIVGHSVGEVAAAYLAGVLSFDDAVLVICHRGRLMQQATGLGRMAALEMPEAEVGIMLTPYSDRISIAAVNSPTSTVISGDRDVIHEIVNVMKNRGGRAKILPLDYAFHSRQMDSFVKEMASAVSGLTLRTASIPIYSTVTGEQAKGAEFDPAYWGQNIRRTVRFAAAIRSMLDHGLQSFVELSPHPVLSGTILECAHGASPGLAALPSLRQGTPERLQMLRSLANLFAAGAEINWAGVYPNGGRMIQLPNYPWQRKRFWFESPAKPPRSTALTIPNAAKKGEPLHGRRLHAAGIGGFVFETRLAAEGLLQGHRVFGAAIVPAPLMTELALSAASEAFSQRSVTVRDLVIHRPLILAEDRERIVQLAFDSPGDSFAEFKIHGADLTTGGEPVWILHATGQVGVRQAEQLPGFPNSEEFEESSFRRDYSASLSPDEVYDLFARQGVHFGAAFRVMRHLDLGENEAVARLSLPEELERELPDYRIHPVLLDAALQTIAVRHVNESQRDDSGESLWLFCGLDWLRIIRTGMSRLTCHAVFDSVVDAPVGVFRGSARLYDERGALVAEIQGARFRQATRESMTISDDGDPAELLFEVAWRPWCCLGHALRRDAADYLPPPEKIEERLRIDLDGRDNEDDESTAEIISGFHQLAAQYVIRAFRELGWNPIRGDRFATREVLARLQIVVQHTRLVERMLGILDEEDLVRRVEEEWEALGPWQEDVSQPMFRNLRQRFPKYGIELELFDRCASRLSDVFRGTCNPLELLFPQGALESTGNVYQDSEMSRGPNGLIRELVKTAAESLPKGRVLRVLEIGAGTGGTTAHLLPLLKEIACEYIFSDVSPLFLEEARKKFSEFPQLRFGILNIERPPDAQGFALQQFDLILAANVLHATADLRQTLAHARSLLVSEGLLALLEGYRPTRWIDLVFGQTEGWWRFVDTDLRPSHPLLSIEAWKRVLEETGFTAVRAVAAGPNNRPSLFDQALVMAKAPAAPVAGSEIVPVPGSKLAAGSKQERSAWLLFSEESLVCDALERLLAVRGNEVVRISKGQEFEILGESLYQVNPTSPGQIKKAVDAALASMALPCRHAVSLWGTSAQEADEVEALSRQTVELCSEALGTAQSLIHCVEVRKPQLWLVTRGAQPPSTSGLPALSGASLWGLGRVIAVEHPEIWGGMLDLDPDASGNESAEAILAQVTMPESEDQCAFRGATRFVPRLVRQLHKDVTREPLVCSSEGCYLVTGGLGGMGLHFAKWLARQGARKLVLLGRTPPIPRSEWETVSRESRGFEQIAAIQEIETLGATVKAVAIDIAEKEEVQSLLKFLDAENWFPIHGLIHTAAVADDQLVPNLQMQGLWTAFRPKVLGALTLEHSLVDQPLQFFICCSSVGALLGQTGQANYAAANAFLDSFVLRRRLKQQPALGINWGGWYGAGLAMTSGGRRTIASLEHRGVLGFQPSQGIAALDLLMRRESTQGTVIRMDWSKFRKAYPPGEEPPFLACLAEDRNGAKTVESEGQESKAPKASWREKLLARGSGPERRSELEKEVTDLLAAVLKLEVAAVDVEKPMGTLGLDSLMGFELKNRCEKRFGLALSATMVWNYPTISALAGHLADKLGVTLTDTTTPPEDAQSVPRTAEGRLTSVLTSVEQLSDDEALNALLRGGGD